MVVQWGTLLRTHGSGIAGIILRLEVTNHPLHFNTFVHKKKNLPKRTLSNHAIDIAGIISSFILRQLTYFTYLIGHWP